MRFMGHFLMKFYILRITHINVYFYKFKPEIKKAKLIFLKIRMKPITTEKNNLHQFSRCQIIRDYLRIEKINSLIV